MIEYIICKYGEFVGRPMIRVVFDDLLTSDVYKIADEVYSLLKTKYNTRGDFVHQFTEQSALLCFDGVGKHDPMEHQKLIIDIIGAIAQERILPDTILIHTSAIPPLEPDMKKFLGKIGEVNTPFENVGGGLIHFVIDLQTLGFTGKSDLVRTDIIKSYICDVRSTYGSINVNITNGAWWDEILAYTAILQSKLFIEYETSIINKMIPIWVYPSTEELRLESVFRGFNTVCWPTS